MSEYIIDWDENLVIDTFSKNSLCEEVVRCRDCRLSVIHDGKTSPKGKQYEGKMYCISWSDGYQGEWTKPDGYCHRGKRRDVGDAE